MNTKSWKTKSIKVEMLKMKEGQISGLNIPILQWFLYTIVHLEITSLQRSRNQVNHSHFESVHGTIMGYTNELSESEQEEMKMWVYNLCLELTKRSEVYTIHLWPLVDWKLKCLFVIMRIRRFKTRFDPLFRIPLIRLWWTEPTDK